MSEAEAKQKPKTGQKPTRAELESEINDVLTSGFLPESKVILLALIMSRPRELDMRFIMQGLALGGSADMAIKALEVPRIVKRTPNGVKLV